VTWVQESLMRARFAKPFLHVVPLVLAAALTGTSPAQEAHAYPAYPAYPIYRVDDAGPLVDPKALEREINLLLLTQKIRGVFADVGSDRVVLLKGVASRFDHFRAVRLASSVRGVREIRDFVFVQ
jgi:hypothetical protein